MSEAEVLRWYSDDDGHIVLAASEDEAADAIREYTGEDLFEVTVEVAQRVWFDLQDGVLPEHGRGEVLEGEL